MNKSLDVILLGRIAIDFNPVEIYRGLEESQTFIKYLGGSPANIAVGLARLGMRVGFMGMVSDDQFGNFVIDYFTKEGIDTSNIVRARNHEKLGLTFTEIKSEQESSILMYRDDIADLMLEVGDIQEEYIKNAKLLVISGTALSASPSREATLKAVILAKKHKINTLFDIDYRPYRWKNKDEIAIYYSIVAKESQLIIGSREEYDLTEALITADSSDRDTANRWLDAGNLLVIIKHGKDGSVAYTPEQTYQVDTYPVKLLKSFGGGDAYASALVYGWLSHWALADCLAFASASASMLVASHSCSKDMPTVEAIKTFMSEQQKAGITTVVREI